MQIIHLACGHTTTDERTCDHCGQPIERDQEAWLRPWLGHPVPARPADRPGPRLTVVFALMVVSRRIERHTRLVHPQIRQARPLPHHRVRACRMRRSGGAVRRAS